MMKQKIIFLFLTCVFLSTSGSAQTINENIDKRIKDPKTAENAAKADVYIIRKNSTVDSVQKNNASPQTERKKIKKARKTCKKKISR